MSPTSHSVITVDKTATRRRWEALRAYCDANVTDGRSFVCSSEARCRSSLRPNVTFHPGQLSYVGSHYDLSVDGTPLRVLIVAMDTGRPDELVTLDRRRSQVAARIPETFSQRNAHMRGTTTALRLLFGRQAGDDRSAEYLEIVDDAGEKDRVHLLDAYAMANLRLCSAIRGDTQSRASGEMSRQCLRHLTATVEVLEPTIVILQGTELRRAIDSELRETTRIAPALERTRFAHCPVLLASFTHPSARSVDKNWARLTSAPYLDDVVVPTLQFARSVAGDRPEPISLPVAGPSAPRAAQRTRLGRVEHPRPERLTVMASNHDDWWKRLVSGPTERIGSLPASTGDEAGVFTIWYRGVLVHYGRAGNAAESKASNHQQADGARGRVRSLARQPGRPLQRLLADRFPEDWRSVNESTDVSRARALLRRDGECRIMRFGSRHEAETAYDSVASRLAQLHGKQPA